MFDNTSDYALNKKDKESIIYKGCDGSEHRITKDYFSSEEEFQFWKSWSDEDYRTTDYKDTYYHRHIVTLDSTGNSLLTAASPEEMLISHIDHAERIQIAKKKIMLISNYITKIQFRRMWYYFALGENVRRIAEREGVVHSCIVASITSAKKKIYKQTSKNTTKTP